MENGKEENIVAMMKEAQATYVKEVMNEQKVYVRYMSDFLNSHRYCGSRDVRMMNKHRKNMGMIEDLLKFRRDLVEKYFANGSMGESEINTLIYELNTTEIPNSQIREANSSSIDTHVEAHQKMHQRVSCRDNCSVSSLQLVKRVGLLEHIVTAMNGLRLFTEKVEVAQIQNLFDGLMEKPLIARNNREFAYFFDALCENQLICKQWQDVLASQRLILSSTGKELKSSDLSSALCKAKMSDRSIYTSIKSMVKEIAKLQESEEKYRI